MFRGYLKNASIPLLILYILLSRIFVYRGIDWTGGMGGGLGQMFYLFLGILIIYYSRNKYKMQQKGSIYNSVVALSIWFACSIFVALVNEGQTVYYSFKGLCSYAYVPILLFFFLYNRKVDNKTLVATLLSLFIVYLLVYGYSYMIFPNYRFGMVADTDEGLLRDFEMRGVFRAGIPYEDLITIFFFFVISNDALKKRTRIIFFFALLYLTMIRGTRFLMAGTLLFGVLLYLKRAKGNMFKSILVFLIVVLLLYMAIQIFGVPSFVENYIEISEKDQESGGDNIRILMSMYYLFDFNSSFSEILLGHGLPINSLFAQQKESMTLYGFFADDVGYIELYLYFGLIGIAILLYMLFSVVKTKVPRNYLFAKYYIYYIFVTMLCGRYLLNNMALVVTMLYLIEHNKIIKNKITSWEK